MRVAALSLRSGNRKRNTGRSASEFPYPPPNRADAAGDLVGNPELVQVGGPATVVLEEVDQWVYLRRTHYIRCPGRPGRRTVRGSSRSQWRRWPRCRVIDFHGLERPTDTNCPNVPPW